MFLRLLAAFVLIPLVELILLLRLADATNWWATLLIVLVTGLIGSALARREGIQAWFRFQTALQNGRMPSQEILDGLMIAFAAALLLTPGLLTDAFGFALLTPAGRKWIGGYFKRRFAGRFQIHTRGFAGNEPASPETPPKTPRGKPSWTIDSPSYGPKQSP